MSGPSKTRTGVQPEKQGVYILHAEAPVSLGVMDKPEGIGKGEADEIEGDQKSSAKRDKIESRSELGAGRFETAKSDPNRFTSLTSLDQHSQTAEKSLARGKSERGQIHIAQRQALSSQDVTVSLRAKPGSQPKPQPSPGPTQLGSEPTAPGTASGLPSPRRGKNQGRRGPYTRSRDRLQPEQVTEINQACLHAERIDAPLNVAVTINLEALKEARSMTSLATKTPNDGLRQYRGDLRRFCRKHGATFALVWVREVSDSAGEHVHMAMHLPDHLLPTFEAFMSAYTGVGCDKVGRDREPGVLARSHDTSWLVKRMFDASGWIAYLTKGVDGSQGVTTGKRAGCTLNIDKAAQAAWRRG